MPGLAVVPVVNIAPRTIALDPVTLLDFALQLITLPGNLIKIIIGEFAPLLLDLAFHLLPISFDSVPIHGSSPLMLDWRLNGQGIGVFRSMHDDGRIDAVHFPDVGATGLRQLPEAAQLQSARCSAVQFAPL
ncbi:hypothetical protein BN77_1412 [Rhizobium mesoamericanum STM3625]|uniref:Uncharacterized protein n=1 Tax=Rhizobium mesoamericanum STM3625 TaxID=1211777 RepID=K0PT29_9HYPH|nr:hypothetical protein BN77_1412 [Rhizobium mesoamericanum STM3625]